MTTELITTHYIVKPLEIEPGKVKAHYLMRNPLWWSAAGIHSDHAVTFIESDFVEAVNVANIHAADVLTITMEVGNGRFVLREQHYTHDNEAMRNRWKRSAVGAVQ